MAAQIPASLKTADIARFFSRASQLESTQPVISYWCHYWIVQQIISRNLQNADEQALIFTTSTVDKLEKYKNEHSTDEGIIDDTVGKALVEQFARQTFERADRAVRADKVSKQTADTFLASATFFDLLEIWGPMENEIKEKTKYAKYHALRIVKAIKNGEDPNLSNPKPEPVAQEDILPPLDPNDPEVQMLNGQSKDRQPSVADAPDESHSVQARLATQSHLNESIHPSRAPSVPPNESAGVSPLPKEAADFYGNNKADVSPISPERKSSTGGNYFPRMPSPTSTGAQPDIPPTLPSAPDTFDQPALDLPSAPPDLMDGPSLPAAPTNFSQPQPLAPKTPLDGFQAPPTPGQPSIASLPPNLPRAPYVPQNIPQAPPAAPRQIIPQQPQPAPLPTRAAPGPSAPPAVAQPPVTAPAEVSEESILRAQKHARWAISALNFDDVPTAIKEFQAALHDLGAR